MKPKRFDANHDKTIESFKKKQIIAICVEQNTRLMPYKLQNLTFQIQKNNIEFNVTSLNLPLYEAVGILNNLSLKEVIRYRVKLEQELTDLAKLYKSRNPFHFVNLWIERYYGINELIVPIKFIEEYTFIRKTDPFIIKVWGSAETREFNQPLIPKIAKPDFILLEKDIDCEYTIRELLSEIEKYTKSKRIDDHRYLFSKTEKENEIENISIFIIKEYEGVLQDYFRLEHFVKEDIKQHITNCEIKWLASYATPFDQKNKERLKLDLSVFDYLFAFEQDVKKDGTISNVVYKMALEQDLTVYFDINKIFKLLNQRNEEL